MNSLQWNAWSQQPHHGIAVPLFSVWSEQSAAIGEYLDLLPLLEWCKEVGVAVVQLLPLNDPGDENSPYSAISVLALNPIHISLWPFFPEGKPLLRQLQQQTNHQQRVDYPTVRRIKMELFQQLFAERFSTLSATDDYRSFIEKHANWLLDYCLYKALKDHSSSSWEAWPEAIRSLAPAMRQQLLLEYSDNIHFHSFLQFLAFQQLSAVRRHADQLGLCLMGDLPILLARDSVDVWRHPERFDLSQTCGAPPDQFAEEGQLWGFPCYRWEIIEAEEFRFWKERLAIAELFYHLYRLDHIIGFFRIWQIPLGKTAKEGEFFPTEEQEWLPRGTRILSALLKASSMLPIGEDLGIIPPSVRRTLERLAIPGTKVMRWERHWQSDHSFIAPADYPRCSLACVSTHDSETLAEWWTSRPDEAGRYAHEQGWHWQPGEALSSEKREALLSAAHATRSFLHVNLLHEYLSLNPQWQRDPSLDRINIPGTILPTNWSARLACSVEQLAANSSFKQTMRRVLSAQHSS